MHSECIGVHSECIVSALVCIVSHCASGLDWMQARAVCALYLYLLSALIAQSLLTQ